MPNKSKNNLRPIAIIIQARMGSTRLPGKALVDIAGQPALARVIERAKQIHPVDFLILATTKRPEDRALVKLAKKHGLKTFTGSENDLLDRYYQTAKKFKVKTIIRITGDCPLLDPPLISHGLDIFLKANGQLDFVAFDDSYPDGLDFDIFSFAALAKAWREAKLPSQREHVAPYMYKNPDPHLFKVGKIKPHRPNLNHLRWTLDEPQDLELIRKIYQLAKEKGLTKFYLKDILELHRQHPVLASINRGIIRNEGLIKSLKKDQPALKPAIDKNDKKSTVTALVLSKKTEEMMSFPRFVAEISSNHNQDLERAKKMIAASAAIGCWAVKFQLFKIDQLFAPEILSRSPRHRERKQWELPVNFLKPLAAHTHQLGLKFSCTPFYLDAVKELEPYVDFYKIASLELLWEPLLAACAKTGKPVVLSTGLATLPETQQSVNILVKNGCRDLTVLHCIAAYPTPPSECNLKAIETLRSKLKVPSRVRLAVGWSDHSVSPAVISRAINRWQAEMIEFHIDLEGKGAEAAAGHCWLPEQMQPVIANIRQGWLADGDGVKKPAASEQPECVWRRDPTDGLRPFKKIRSNWHAHVPDPHKYPLDSHPKQ